MSYPAHKRLNFIISKAGFSDKMSKTRMKVKFYTIYGVLMALIISIVLLAKML